MNQGFRYYSNSHQDHLQYNYQIQPYTRPSNLNSNRFQQEEQNFYIQNDLQQYRNINQDNQLTKIQQHNNIQEIRRDFTNNNNINDDQNQNTEQFEFTEQQLRAIYLFAVLEQVIAIILIAIFYYIKNLQQYLIDENTLQLNNITFYCMHIPIFVLLFIIFIVYRGDRNPSEVFIRTAILTYTLIFQYSIVCYGILQFKKLNQGFLYIQITQGLIILILVVFIIRPKQSFNLRYFLIVIVSTLLLVLFISIFFEDLKFWWMFGIPVITYFLLLKLSLYFGMCRQSFNSILILIHYGIFQMMICVFFIISLFE